MITTFGNDDSESEESETEKAPLPKSCLKKSKVKSEKSTSSSNSEPKDSKQQMGPIGPPVAPLNYGPLNKEKPIDKPSQVK